jgi:hypothetical protein
MRSSTSLLMNLLYKCHGGLVWFLEIVNKLNCVSVFGRAGPSSSVDEDLNNKTCCVVCQDNDKTVVLLPCRHLCLCIVCYRTIKRMRLSQRLCPICRVKIDDYISVYM